MKRAACLLLLFAVWLLALPSAGAPRPQLGPATVSVSAGKACLAVQQVVEQVAALPRVLPARYVAPARLPALPQSLPCEHVRSTHRVYACAPDLREALRRVQTRRRVPRLSSEEPPWSCIAGSPLCDPRIA